MAKYEIKQFEIRTDKCYHNYVYAELYNTENIWEFPFGHTFHDKRVVEAFKQCDVNEPLPNELKYVYGEWIDYYPPFAFCKKHLSDHPELGKKAGSLVTDKFGNVRIYNSLRVFCLKYSDNGIVKYQKGNYPDEVAYRALAAFCVPYKERVQAQPYMIMTEDESGHTTVSKQTLTEKDAQLVADTMNSHFNVRVTLYQEKYSIRGIIRSNNSDVVSTINTGCAQEAIQPHLPSTEES